MSRIANTCRFVHVRFTCSELCADSLLSAGGGLAESLLEEGELAPDWKQVVLQAGGGTTNIFLCSSCLYSGPTEEDIATHAALHQASGVVLGTWPVLFPAFRSLSLWSIVADPGCLSRILIFTLSGSETKNSNKREG
jgi:hypothetical protein